MSHRISLHVLALIGLAAVLPSAAVAQSLLLYVGPFITNTTSRGIYGYRLNTATGELTELGLAAETANPTFLALAPNRKFLYATNEISDYEGRREGSVSAFSIDRSSGKLTLLNRVSTRTAGPTHLALDSTGRMLVVANYDGGSVESYRVKPDGSLSEIVSFDQHTGSSVNPQRQKRPHAHMAKFAPDDRFVFVPDLGTDTVVAYRPDVAAGSITRVPSLDFKVKPGAGARHMDFHPNGKFAYVISEMGSTITVFGYDAATGETNQIEVVTTLPAGFSGTSAGAEIFVDKSGRFLYASNRGDDSIAEFAIDAKTGKLTPVGFTPTHGKTPRNFAIDPTGRWLVAANRISGNLVPFQIDPKSGKLTQKGKILEFVQPACVLFAPAR